MIDLGRTKYNQAVNNQVLLQLTLRALLTLLISLRALTHEDP